MKKILSFILLSSVAFTGCEELKNKLLQNSVEGIYRSADKQQLEITASKLIMTDVGKKDPMSLTFDYKQEGKHLFLENRSNVGGMQSMLMAMANIQFEVVDANTVKMVSTSFLGGKTNTFKRVENQ